MKMGENIVERDSLKVAFTCSCYAHKRARVNVTGAFKHTETCAPTLCTTHALGVRGTVLLDTVVRHLHLEMLRLLVTGQLKGN